MTKKTKTLAFFDVSDSLAGFFLLLATLLALLWANSPWQETYEAFWGIKAGLSLREIVNEVLMSFFFLMIGCELKRERREGELVSLPQVKLPLVAAVGGMAVPALVFFGINILCDPGFSMSHPAAKGWAIPTATDIAFALGIFSFLGRRAPQSLRSFLLVLAIADDLGAVLIIGLFYSSAFHPLGLAAAGFAGALLWQMNQRGVKSFLAYGAAGGLLWVSVLYAGLHAPLAGLFAAFALPMRAGDRSPLRAVESSIHPWVAGLIMPIFAFANAGVSIGGIAMDELAKPLLLSLVAGLFVGKAVGVGATTWFAVRAGFASLPRKTNWAQLYGLSFLCGVGFTMSLLIGVLAFQNGTYHFEVRAGILLGSALSALAGSALLYFAASAKTPR